MSANGSKAGMAGMVGKTGQAGQGSFPTIGSQALLEKLSIRQSTPDSEALASSDDEIDPLQVSQPQPAPVHQQKSLRRASWLNDTSQVSHPQPRKSSFASSNMSPTASHPSTPSVETGATGVWGPHTALNRAHLPQGSSVLTWGTGIWNSSDRKDASARLAEVLPSPTTGVSPFGGDKPLTQASPGPRESSTNAQIPFAIPLHPTPKTYRSQSYSVGQLDSAGLSTPGVPSPTALPNRARPIGHGHAGLQHRPSRPSMLSEMSNEGAMLGKVKEDEDDDDEDGYSPCHRVKAQQSAESKTIELLARENFMLRQQQQQQTLQKSRLRTRSSTANAFAIGNGHSLTETVPEEADFAVDELDEGGDSQGSRAGLTLTSRRLSEFGVSLYPVENRQIENIRRGAWSTFGIGDINDASQSRRHSFADLQPTRHGSIGSIGDPPVTHEPMPLDTQDRESGGFLDAYSLNGSLLSASRRSVQPQGSLTSVTPLYLNGGSGSGSGGGSVTHPLSQSSTYVNPLGSGNTFGSGNASGVSYGYNRPPSPRSITPPRTVHQPKHNQALYIVLFKCSRAEVFYLPEGSGLAVVPGDLVIVEADRGIDLGTVDHSCIDWQTAKELKEHYAEEHYKWLMMYSHNAAAQEAAGVGLSSGAGHLSSAIGGMGPPGHHHHMAEPGAGELKPKMIKRIACINEIQQLREKEGNEAKAKRICMQKVKEHGLNMEILDAEFQLDWRKLTFYYFADAYINFNSLVTDLFKIYKTRIWMSAINPASFVSPSLGLQAPSGIGPGAIGTGRNGGAASTHRRAHQQQRDRHGAFTAGMLSSSRAFQQPYQPFGERANTTSSNYQSAGFSYTGYGDFGDMPRAGAPYMPSMMNTMDAYTGGGAYSGAFGQGSDYQALRGPRFPHPHAAPSAHNVSASTLSGQNDWVSSFQGLSLNSR